MSFLLALILGTSAQALTFTSTVAGSPAAIRCATAIQNDRVWVYFHIEKGLLLAGEELAVQWIPPIGSRCDASTLVARNLGDKSAFKFWLSEGEDPCTGQWTFAFTIRDRSTKIVRTSVLTSGIRSTKDIL